MIKLENTKYESKEKKDSKDGKKKKRWLSPTAINSYLRCPRHFYLSKIKKIKQKPSIHLIRGIAVHKAVEKFYANKMNQYPDMDYSELRHLVIGLFKTEWEDKTDSLDSLELTVDELDFYNWDSQMMMLNFLDDFVRNKGFSKPDPVIEKTLFSHKYLLLARLDKIEKQLLPHYIEDFKTSKSMEITEEIKRQMGICSLLYQEVYKRKPILGVNFLKFKNGRKIIDLSDDYIEGLKQLVLEIHAKTQSEHIKDYPCKCRWCHRNFDIMKDSKDTKKGKGTNAIS